MTQTLPEIPQRGQCNDCTVVALATCTGQSYDTVALVLRDYKKRDNCGFRIYEWLREHEGQVLGCQFTPVWKHTGEGIYLVGNQGHVASIVDGKLIHRLSGGIRYSKVFRVERLGAEDATLAKLRKAQATVAAAMQD